MSRVQLALNVADLDEAVGFYATLLGAEPTTVRPGYASFAVAEPPLTLVLIENATRAPGSLNHLGVEVDGTEMVDAARRRLAQAGLSPVVDEGVVCCCLRDKVWVHGPGGEPWEFYTVVPDAEVPARGGCVADRAGVACCATRPDVAVGLGGPAPSCC